MAPIFVIAYSSALSSLLPLIWSIRTWNSGATVKLVGVLTGLSFFSDLLGFYLARQGANTYPIANLFFLAQSILIVLMYAEVFKWPRRVVNLILLIYSILYLINYTIIQKPTVLNSYSFAGSSIGIMVITLLYFRFLLNHLPETFIHRIPMVWVSISFLVYFSGNLFLFILFTSSTPGSWILHNMLNITKNILLFVALWHSRRKISSTSL